MNKTLAGLVLLVSFLSGCSHLGPQTIPRDRFDYNTAVSDSWKEQTLMNIVKLRYADVPLFVDVSSIVSGYTLESAANVAGNANLGPNSNLDALSLGGSAKFTDRPTITYVPITGDQFNRAFMRPIPPDALLFLMQSGWPVDLIFPLTIDSINGHRSLVRAGANRRAGDDAYYRIITLMREVQKSGASGMRIVKGKDDKDSTVLFFHKELLTPELKANLTELHALLGMSKERTEVNVTYGFLARNDAEIAMITRSMLHILVTLATQIDVPPEHVAEGRTPASAPLILKNGERVPQLFTVKHSSDKPDDAFAAVRYKNYWYWVDDRDFNSKRTLTFLMILFSLGETGDKQGLPLVTIPAG